MKRVKIGLVVTLTPDYASMTWFAASAGSRLRTPHQTHSWAFFGRRTAAKQAVQQMSIAARDVVRFVRERA